MLYLLWYAATSKTGNTLWLFSIGSSLPCKRSEIKWTENKTNAKRTHKQANEGIVGLFFSLLPVNSSLYLYQAYIQGAQTEVSLKIAAILLSVSPGNTVVSFENWYYK